MHTEQQLHKELNAFILDGMTVYNCVMNTIFDSRVHKNRKYNTPPPSREYYHISYIICIRALYS